MHTSSSPAIIQTSLRAVVERWLESDLKVELSRGCSKSVAVVAVPDPEFELRAVRCGDRHLIVARDSWTPQLLRLCETLEPDLLFSIFGAYELGRVAVPNGFGVWGPTWWLFADKSSWHPREQHQAVQLSTEEQAQIDFEIFWHCYPVDECVAAFGIHGDDRLLALATVADKGQPFMEIGVDVVPGEKTRGLGSSVISAAGNWILDQGCLPMAGVGPFNVPSARALRGAGLAYGFTDLVTSPGPFRIPPQPLGKPTPTAELLDHYPMWAMNPDIRQRREHCAD
jgi:hypothetical protein